MSTFSEASASDLKRLLELFPIADLRKSWPDVKGDKESISSSIARTRDLRAIAAFVDENLARCKQHVYVFTSLEKVEKLPSTLLGQPVLAKQASRSLYVLRTRYDVIVRDPLGKRSAEFLWPISLEVMPGKVTVVLRCAMLEKAMSAYFGEGTYITGRTLGESHVTSEMAALDLERVDLHKGLKKLWEDGFMDSPSAKVKKTISMATETMDESRGIKKYNQELYRTIHKSLIIKILFYPTDGRGLGVTAFSAKPSDGYLAFPRYSGEGGTDRVIREILANNQ
jgi:hypothetical protein